MLDILSEISLHKEELVYLIGPRVFSTFVKLIQSNHTVEVMDYEIFVAVRKKRLDLKQIECQNSNCGFLGATNARTPKQNRQNTWMSCRRKEVEESSTHLLSRGLPNCASQPVKYLSIILDAIDQNK